MISDRDILSAAWLMLQQHGEEAALACVERATKLLHQGDHEGHRVWLEVIRALPVLEKRPGSLH